MADRPFLRRGPSGPLATGDDLPFGAGYQYVESLPQQSTTGGPLTTLSLVTPNDLEGTFRVGFQCRAGSNTATAVIKLESVTDAVTLCQRSAAVGSDDRSVSGFADVLFLPGAGPKMFSITIQKTGGPGSVRGSEFRIELWQVLP